MRALLAIEWLKIKSFRTFWILTGFFVLLLPLWNYGISNGIMKIGGGDINLVSQAYSFSYVWQNMGFWTSIFVVFISILTIILTTNEYQYRPSRLPLMGSGPGAARLRARQLPPVFQEGWFASFYAARKLGRSVALTPEMKRG